MSDVSVIITTRNPRLSYLRRVIEALKAQTLPKAEWDLLLVDNASDQPFVPELNLEWHPNAAYTREENVGLARARICGISESKGALLVFMDDDNVLNPDYLANAVEIARRHPMLGTWSGQLVPDYEVAPVEAIRPYLQLLGIRTLKRDIWGNDLKWEQIPIGAGMCVRREVALRYRQDVINNPLRLFLGHAGSHRSCHEDTDLAITSFDVGLGIGLFQSLILTHLIPERKLNEKYLLQLLENSAAALVVLKTARKLRVEEYPRGARWCLEQLRYWSTVPVHRKIIAARWRGMEMGRAIAADLIKKNQESIKSSKKLDVERDFTGQQTIQHAAEPVT